MTKSKKNEEPPKAESPDIEDAVKDVEEIAQDADSEPEIEDAVLIEEEDVTPEEEAGHSEQDDTEPEPDATEPDVHPSDVEPQPEPVAAAPAPDKRRSGFGGTFLGGVIAAGLGFGVCYYLVQQGVIGGADPVSFDAERAQIADLETRLSDLANQPAPTAEPDPRVAELTTAVEGLNGQLSALDEASGRNAESISALREDLTQLAEAGVAAAEGGTGGAELAALQAALAEQQAENLRIKSEIEEIAASARSEIEAVQQSAGALQSETQSALETAAAQGALARLSTALEAGTPYATILDEIGGLGVEIDPTLMESADTGVPTLLSLQRGFPAAARDGLAAARKENIGSTPLERMKSFVEVQLGARSLEAKDGDSADAVLSRAEAELRAGALREALAELDTLSDGGRAAMAGWISDAESRAAALDATDGLVAAITEN